MAQRTRACVRAIIIALLFSLIYIYMIWIIRELQFIFERKKNNYNDVHSPIDNLVCSTTNCSVSISSIKLFVLCIFLFFVQKMLENLESGDCSILPIVIVWPIISVISSYQTDYCIKCGPNVFKFLVHRCRCFDFNVCCYCLFVDFFLLTLFRWRKIFCFHSVCYKIVIATKSNIYLILFINIYMHQSRNVSIMIVCVCLYKRTWFLPMLWPKKKKNLTPLIWKHHLCHRYYCCCLCRQLHNFLFQNLCA